MKILIVGGTGLIGQAVKEELGSRHDIIIAGSQSGDIQVDITDLASIQALYKKTHNLDAIIATTGRVKFAPINELDSEDYHFGLSHKLMGQVNLVLQGISHLNHGGSFTLTSGILNYDPIVQGSSAAMVNGAIDGFVRSTAIELPNSLRINTVSPTVVTEALSRYENYFRGYAPAAAAEVAKAYSKSVEGKQTGQIYKVGF
ncbi:short chain dehydrogenase [Piscirickettsia litoralis]|uniref:Short chain dehydrogenase n=1 Tax=Piscirickettsia litoralis TaxID=1891921 RepID=A0ABX2ZYY7_9GAMM|nr:short chain dehydrogenase [Piscirickettsia litoralis]ODN41728.1 short chain dehydrogenase [Piscirickettsia litoralis]